MLNELLLITLFWNKTNGMNTFKILKTKRKVIHYCSV